MTLEQKITLIGYILKDPQFKKRYNEATISEDLINSFKKKFPEGGEIKIISASWCKDCVELVPIFGKISEILPEWSITMIDRGILSYKDRVKYDIQHIPTFIFFDKNGHEIGRIVEKPKTNSLEEDMASFSLN
ncbi:MAG: thioredoxin family protein [Candidatus Hodarchaeales archaeon]|jgi:thiol-disulfide isomerase/thioredoxin